MFNTSDPKLPAATGTEKAGIGGLVLPLLLVSVVGAGAGALFAMALAPKPAETPGHTASKPVDEEKPALQVLPVPKIITNLAGPARTFIRLESAIAVDADTPSPEALAAKISEDFLSYLRTTTLAQIEGPSGFQYLREELLDRAALRSKGKVRDVMIQTFAVE
jgi:flagellar FliL protein